MNQAPAPAPIQKERHPQTNSSIFNQEPDAPQQQQQRHPQTNSTIFNQEAQTAAPRQQQQLHPQMTSSIFNQEANVVAPRQQQQQRQEDSIIFGGQRTNGSNAYANGANQNCGNVLTDRSTTRLHAPPGGASTFKLY